MFQANEDGKSDSTKEESRLLPGQNDRQDQDSVQEAVVLEMDVVNDEEAGREQDR